MSDVSLLSAGTPAPASNHQPAKLLYSRKECAYALSISIRSLDLALEANELKCRRIGRRVLIAAEELFRYSRKDHVYLTQFPQSSAQ
jgi:hypothetical protein